MKKAKYKIEITVFENGCISKVKRGNEKIYSRVFEDLGDGKGENAGVVRALNYFEEKTKQNISKDEGKISYK